MQTRYAEQRDLDALAKLHVETWRSAYRGMMPSEFLDALDDSHALVRLVPVINASPPRICVVDFDNEPVAFCRFGPSKDADVPLLTVEIFAINVAPSRWRNGIGRLLIERTLAEGGARGFAACTLWVLTENSRARRFYEATGFELDGATRIEAASSDHPLHEVRYRRKLAHVSTV
jgi:ribosomal protein S18 acetylase RimI-like enzyme